MTQYTYNDGGRHEALKETNDTVRFSPQGNPRDCVTRALAIMTQKPYTEIWHALADINRNEGRRHSANFGVFVDRQGFRDYSESLGLIYALQ